MQFKLAPFQLAKVEYRKQLQKYVMDEFTITHLSGAFMDDSIDP